MSFFWLVVLLVGLFLFARWFLGFGVGAPYLPIRARDILDAFELVPVSSQDVVIDLGSGDGRILIAAAERGAIVAGYELNPLLVWISRLRLRRFHHSQIFRRDLRRADLSRSTVIFVFGITKLMPQIAEMLSRLDHPVKVISFAFEFPGHESVAEKGIVKVYAFGKKHPLPRV